MPQEAVVPYVVSNVVALVLVGCALRWPNVARWLYALIFVAAAGVNVVTALQDAQVYLSYAAGAVGPYREFIQGVFARNTRAFVLAIAAGQLAAGLLLAVGGRALWAGVLGGVVFLVAIAPLGVGSAFPATLIMAAGLYLAYRRRPSRPATA